MKHVSEIIQQVLDQQLFLQSKLEAHALKLNELSNSSSISTLATLPQLEADLCVLGAMHKQIGQSISSAGNGQAASRMGSYQST